MSKPPSVFLPPEETRLVTICAHVDHGKTTLADNLIESNGIISERLAGTLRCLDSMEEEQRRGITMRASAIGLRHQYTPPPGKQQKQQQQSSSSTATTTPIIVHLLDSPGHTDFSTEVSSSLQCCDGCLLVVDAVEGMCARTHQVVREAHSHQLVPILVINKVDRLCTNLCLTPTEAYLRLRSLLESVNAACAAMLLSKRAEEQQQDTKDDNNNSQSRTTSNGDQQHQLTKEEEEEELRWTFDPQRDNVIFASALFGWGFSVPSLARSLFRHKILSIKPVMLKQYLFGDFYFKPGEDANTGKMMKWKADQQQQQMHHAPLFAEYGLQPLWDIYEGIAAAALVAGLGSTLFADGRMGDTNSSNSAKKKGSSDGVKIQATTPGMDEVLRAMQIGSTSIVNGNSFVVKSVEELQQILTRTGCSSSEEGTLRSLLRRYRPLSDSVLSAVYEICPSPIEAAEHVRPRALALANPIFDDGESDDQKRGFEQIQQSVRTCDVSAEAPCTAYVCKFMATDRSQIRDPEHFEDENESSTVILGLARVLSGRLRTGDSYYVLGPKHQFGDQKTMAKSRPIRLFLLMGSSFVLVNEVPAGHLCAVQYLEDFQYKTATLCDSPNGMPLRGFGDMRIRPLVKVNVEAVDPADTPWLEKGLVKLSLADASVEVTATAKGERILACLGELHLEQSVLDLQKVYCDREVQLRISEPIVEFGETTAWFGDNEIDFQGFLSENSKKAPPLRQLKVPPYNEEEGIENTDRGRSRSTLSGRTAAIHLRAVPLDSGVFESLKQGKITDGSEAALQQLGCALGFSKTTQNDRLLAMLSESIVSTDDNDNAMAVSKALESGQTVVGVESDEIYVNKNIIPTNEEENNIPSADGESEYNTAQQRIRDLGFSTQDSNEGNTLNSKDRAALQVWKEQMQGSLIAGFQMAMRHGPICEEPVRHVLIVLEGMEVALKEDSESKSGYKTAGPISGGMVAAALRIGIRSALLSRPARLVESHLKLTLNSSLTGLGPLYQVLSKRRGKVLEDSMVDGTDLLLIAASLPHAESFGLAPELFRASSGEVTAPELIFSHWEILDQDPFWIPSTLEEREDFGEILQSGDVSTGLDNTALKYIRKVRERKGLLVDSSRTVVAAEKQRTIKK